jgi:hypothetical protein
MGRPKKTKDGVPSKRILKSIDWKPWRIGQMYERPENQDELDAIKSQEAYKRLSGKKKS